MYYRNNTGLSSTKSAIYERINNNHEIKNISRDKYQYTMQQLNFIHAIQQL